MFPLLFPDFVELQWRGFRKADQETQTPRTGQKRWPGQGSLASPCFWLCFSSTSFSMCRSLCTPTDGSRAQVRVPCSTAGTLICPLFPQIYLFGRGELGQKRHCHVVVMAAELSPTFLTSGPHVTSGEALLESLQHIDTYTSSSVSSSKPKVG